MSALFKWNRQSPKPRSGPGDKRIVTRFLLWPKCVDGEWRWLGFERIQQEAYEGWSIAPDGPAFKVIEWRSVKWVS